MRTFALMTDRKDWRGVRVLLRLDLNVPIVDGEVRDAYRIERILPTLRFLREAGARTVVIAHIGKGKPEETLAPVAVHMTSIFPVAFVRDLLGESAHRAVAGMRDGDVVLLENLRHDSREESNDPGFAKALAAYGDIFINDAFAVSHRAHASVVGVSALLPSYAGILFGEEVAHLSLALDPEHPFLFVLGGAKISTKLPLLKKFLALADCVFVGGANANDFLRLSGREVGKSLIDPDAAAGIEKHLGDPRLLIPEYVVVAPSREEKPVSAVATDDAIVDVGPSAIDALSENIRTAKLIVWNGPLGLYEKGYTGGTRRLLDLIVKNGTTAILGGGDTVALINDLGMLERFAFVSTGGGAMLEFLADETLPGIEALKQ